MAKNYVKGDFVFEDDVSFLGKSITRYIQCSWGTETTNSVVGDGKFRFHIPPELNGYNLIYVHACLTTAPTGSGQTYQIYNETDSVDMLSTALTIDVSETDSSTAATAAVINTSTDDVATNDIIRIDCDVIGSTTPGTGDKITLGFQAP